MNNVAVKFGRSHAMNIMKCARQLGFVTLRVFSLKLYRAGKPWLSADHAKKVSGEEVLFSPLCCAGTYSAQCGSLR